MYRFALIALTTALTPVAVSAQTAPAPAPAPAAAAPAAGATASAGAAVGATVYDAQGGVVGTIASTDGTNAVIDTGTVKAAVPVASLGMGAKGPTLGMTKAQLDAAAGAQQAQAQTQAQAQFKSQLVTGATVYGTGGASLGTIKAIDAQYVTVTTAKGDAKLPIGGFGPGPQGVTVGLTAAQLDAGMSGAGAGAAPGAAASPAPAATPTPEG